jgi:hypothetical protein
MRMLLKQFGSRLVRACAHDHEGGQLIAYVLDALRRDLLCLAEWSPPWRPRPSGSFRSTPFHAAMPCCSLARRSASGSAIQAFIRGFVFAAKKTGQIGGRSCSSDFSFVDWRAETGLGYGYIAGPGGPTQVRVLPAMASCFARPLIRVHCCRRSPFGLGSTIGAVTRLVRKRGSIRVKACRHKHCVAFRVRAAFTNNVCKQMPVGGKSATAKGGCYERRQ